MLASFHHHTTLMTCRLQGSLSCWTSFHFPTLALAWPGSASVKTKYLWLHWSLSCRQPQQLTTMPPPNLLLNWIIIKLRLAFYLGWGWPGRKTLLQSRRNEDLQAERREERGHQPFLFSCPVIHFIKAGVSGISFSSIISSGSISLNCRLIEKQLPVAVATWPL